jgi:hypothetical protein
MLSGRNPRFASGWIWEPKKDKAPKRRSKLLEMPDSCGRLSLKKVGGLEKILSTLKLKALNIMRKRGRNALSQS